VVASVGALAGAACGDDDAPTGEVDPAAALTAVVEWQAADQEPVVDADGEPLLPVIYVAPGDGDTIDVGVQAAVAEAVADVATVRFADDVADAFDEDVVDQPVIDQGVVLLLGPMPDPAPVVVMPLERFTDAATSEALALEITADPEATGIGPATVTAVTPP
jgi:hypothetical protein